MPGEQIQPPPQDPNAGQGSPEMDQLVAFLQELDARVTALENKEEPREE